MTAFDSLYVKWDGEEYEIKPEKFFGLIKRIEDVTFSQDIHKTYESDGRVRQTALAETFVTVIEYATSKRLSEVDKYQIYLGIKTEDDEELVSVANALNTIMGFQKPPETLSKRTKAIQGNVTKKKTLKAS